MLGRVLRITLWVVSAVALAGWLVLAWRGLESTATRDPIESSIVTHASRIAEGQDVYPEADAAPAAMMPVFPYMVAGLVWVSGPQPWAARMVAVLATLIAALLVALIVRAETQSTTLGTASAALLLLALDPAASGAALSRPDALMMVLVLAGCLALRFMSSIVGALLAAVALAAACFTEVSGLWFAFAVLGHLASHDRRRLVMYGLALLAFVAGGQLALSTGLGPWFNHSAWDAAFETMRFHPAVLLRFLGTQLLGTLGVLTLATVLAFALPVRPWRGAVGIWTWVAGAALLAGLATTQSAGEWADALRPAAVALAIVGPVSIQRVTQHLSAWPGSSRLGGQSVVLAALVLQFVTLLASVAPRWLGAIA